MRRAMWMVIGLLVLTIATCAICTALIGHESIDLVASRARIFRDMLQFGNSGLSLSGWTDWINFPLGIEIDSTEWVPELDGLASLLADHLVPHHIIALYIVLITSFSAATACWIGYRFLHRQMATRLALVAASVTAIGAIVGLIASNSIIALHWLTLGLIIDVILVKRVMSKINIPSRLVCDRAIVCGLSFGAGWGAVSWVGLLPPIALAVLGLLSGHSRKSMAPWSIFKRIYFLPMFLSIAAAAIFFTMYLPTEIKAVRLLAGMDQLAMAEFAQMVIVAVMILSIIFATEMGSFVSIKILSALVVCICAGMLAWNSGVQSLRQRLSSVVAHVRHAEATDPAQMLQPENSGDAVFIWPSCLLKASGSCTFPDVQSYAAKLVARGFKVSSLLPLAWRADETLLSKVAAQGLYAIDREQVRGCPSDDAQSLLRSFADYNGFHAVSIGDSHVAKDCRLREKFLSQTQTAERAGENSFMSAKLEQNDLSRSPEDPSFSLDARGMVQSLVDIVTAESIARVVAPFSWRKMLQIALRDSKTPLSVSIEYVEGAAEIFTALREMDGCLDCAAIITADETSHIPNGWRVVTRTDQIVLLRPSSPINQGEPRLTFGESFSKGIDIRGDEVRWSGSTLEVKLTDTGSDVTFPLVRLPENARLKMGIAVADFAQDVEFEVWFADAVVYRKVLTQRMAVEDFEVDLRPYVGIESNVRLKSRRLRGQGDVMVSWLQPQLMGLAAVSP
jgi:hypothetical protein